MHVRSGYLYNHEVHLHSEIYDASGARATHILPRGWAERSIMKKLTAST